MDYVASAVMQREVKVVPPTMTIPELEQLFLEQRVSGFPVVEDGKLVGVVSRTDVFRALCPKYDLTEMDCPDPEGTSPAAQPSSLADSLAKAGQYVTVAEIMSSDVVTVAPDDRLHEVADLMYKKRIHRICVVEDGNVTGIITPFDFVRLYSTDRIGVEGRPSKTQDF